VVIVSMTDSFRKSRFIQRVTPLRCLQVTGFEPSKPQIHTTSPPLGAASMPRARETPVKNKNATSLSPWPLFSNPCRGYLSNSRHTGPVILQEEEWEQPAKNMLRISHGEHKSSTFPPQVQLPPSPIQPPPCSPYPLLFPLCPRCPLWLV